VPTSARWRPHREGDAEVERLTRLQRRFRRVSRRAGLYRRRQLFRRAKGMILIAIVAGAALHFLMTSPWSVGLTLRHLAAAPNCDAARAVGLAPLAGESRAIGRATIAMTTALHARCGADEAHAQWLVALPIEHCVSSPVGRRAMTDGLLPHSFSREVDPLNYEPALARLGILDALTAPSERRRRIGSGRDRMITASLDVDRRERVRGCGAGA
jgi:hypothetical protein